VSFRVGLFAGTLAALIAALPASLRVEPSAPVFGLLAGAAAALLGPLGGGLCAARPLPGSARAALVGLGLSALPLAVLGMVLKTATHHRPLGAVVFALLGAVVVVACALLSARVLWAARAVGPEPRRARWIQVMTMVAVAGPVLLAVRLASASGASRAVFDAALALGALAVLLWVKWPDRLLLMARRAAVPLWALVVGTAIWLGRAPAMDQALSASPSLAAPLGWMFR
jgi:hypothetical protein